MAEVLAEITRGNGMVGVARYKLVREKGEWKIDGVSGPTSQNEPVHPESAVADVIKWAHESGAANFRDWFEKQPTPAICKALAADRNQLPDEVKYHDVDDVKARERLLNGLDPVIKLIGCSNRNGVVFYQGETVYAGKLNDGRIAITPGGLYFAGSPPNENIFHDLAKLRILLAREIFRQMIAVENSTSDLNQADVMLRRELKLDYLAALVGLAVDKDSTVLDAAALDLATYGKPIGIVSGMQGTPSLQQIKTYLERPNRIIADRQAVTFQACRQIVAKTNNQSYKRALEGVL